MFIGKTKTKIISAVIVLFLGVFVLARPTAPVRAQEVVSDPLHTVWTVIKGVIEQAYGAANEAANTLSASLEDKRWYESVKENILLPVLKQVAIQKVNDLTTAVVTGGNSGKPYLVTDWNQYLITGPADEARVYVNSLLNNSMRGRASATDYSNSAYPAYLLRQAQEAIKKPEAIDPMMVHSNDATGDLFAGGDMRAFNEYFTPGKNPYSYTLLAENTLGQVTADKRLIAEKEVVNGYIPKKDALGMIVTPAAVFENAFNSASNMGREMVVNATKTSELAGAVVNFVINTAMSQLEKGLLGN